MGDYTRVVDTASLITGVQPNDSVSVVNARLGRGSVSSAASGRTVWLKRLSVFQLVLAILLLITGFTCFIDTHASGNYHGPSCILGIGGWTSIFYLVCSSLGITATFSQKRRRCLFVSYFVLLIIGAVLNGILVFVSTIYLLVSSNSTVIHPSEYGHYRSPWSSEEDDNDTTTTTTISPAEMERYYSRLRARNVAIVYNAILVVLSVTHLISIVVSASLMCAKMSKTGGCCGAGQDEGEPTVLYVSPPEGSGAKPQIIVLPKNLNGEQPVTIQMKVGEPNEERLSQ